MQVRRPKGVSSERKAFVSRAVQASAAACNHILNTYKQTSQLNRNTGTRFDPQHHI